MTSSARAHQHPWSRRYRSITTTCRTYSRYERRIKGILREPKQYARFADSRVSDQQQFEQIVVGFCHRQLNPITPIYTQPINSIIGSNLKRMPRLRPLQLQQHQQHLSANSTHCPQHYAKDVRISKCRSAVSLLLWRSKPSPFPIEVY